MSSQEQTREILLKQPAELQKKSKAFAQFFRTISPWEKAELVGIVARGSQYNAAVTAKYLIELGLGIPVVVLTPSIITKHMSELKYPRSLVIGFESAGSNDEIHEVMNAMGSTGHQTLAFSPDPDWQTEAAADYVLDLGVADLDSPLETASYLSHVLAAFHLVSAMGALAYVDGPTELKIPDDEWVRTCLESADAGAAAVRSAKTVLTIGRGYGYSASMELALKLSSTGGAFCKAYSSAELAQVGASLLNADTSAVVFGETPSLLADSDAVVHTTPSVSLGPIEELWHGIYAHCLASAVSITAGRY
jgi:glucosamine--fructose-6-phosphate aminotransferase (isomerizing)